MNTFKKINQGDLVIRRGPNEADVRFVEDVWKEEDLNVLVFPDDQINVLLVNGHEDLSYEGEVGIKEFNKEWRLLVKKEHLTEGEM